MQQTTVPGHLGDRGVVSGKWVWLQPTWGVVMMGVVPLQCSEEIYEGVQYRTVHCEEVATGDVTDHTHCSVSSKPDTARICRLANCEDGECYRWSPQEWSEVRVNHYYSFRVLTYSLIVL